MSHLSEALTRHYTRTGNKIIFSNGQSLNQLAVSLWTFLRYQHMDTSTLSRVLKGERLFTATQLHAFCEVLRLNPRQTRHLHASLQWDHNDRIGIALGVSIIEQDLLGAAMCELGKDTFTLFYGSQYESLAYRHQLIVQLSEIYFLKQMNDRESIEAFGFSLYMHGRVIANGELSSKVLDKIRPIYQELIRLSRLSSSSILYGYAHVLLCTAYYLAGGYSDAQTKKRFYAKSINLARVAMHTLPVTDNERLFALRSMAASAAYLSDHNLIQHVLKIAKHDIIAQPRENYINGLHLSITLTKSLVVSGHKKPYSIQEFTTNYFNQALVNTGVYEVSGIKEEVDTLRLLGCTDTSYIRRQTERGLHLASQYDLSRQKKYFSSLLSAT
ncbi:MAG TPA: hypothetical protein VFN56_04220 [Candidatus Saccharimonadales bacterium]|nr:hypothetical protein [Candidatus Saccharimonadales bacterium]